MVGSVGIRGARNKAGLAGRLRYSRRRWSFEQKRAIVVESQSPHASAAAIARKYGIGTGQLYTWRRQLLSSRLAGAACFARVELAGEPPRLANPANGHDRNRAPGRGVGAGGHPAAVYMYSADRKGDHPEEHLKGYDGLLQVDGYAGFNGLVTDPAGGAPQLAFCWAHTRRKFHDIFAATKAPLD
jgi:transposase-like protein